MCCVAHTDETAYTTFHYIHTPHPSSTCHLQLIPHLPLSIPLSALLVTIGREAWIREAEDCEHAGAQLTCAAIIQQTIHMGRDRE